MRRMNWNWRPLCCPVAASPVHWALWWPGSPFWVSCAGSGTRSWSGVPSDRGRAPFRSAASASGSGSCGTPSPVPASGSACTSGGRGVAIRWHLFHENVQNEFVFFFSNFSQFHGHWHKGKDASTTRVGSKLMVWHSTVKSGPRENVPKVVFIASGSCPSACCPWAVKDGRKKGFFLWLWMLLLPWLLFFFSQK